VSRSFEALRFSLGAGYKKKDTRHAKEAIIQKIVIGTHLGCNSATMGANMAVSLAKKLKIPKVVEA
jgi:hypothetical protein